MNPESHDRVLFAKLGLEALGVNPIPHAEAMHEAYWDAVLGHMEIREGVLHLLTRLKAAGVPVGICTNMNADIQMRKLCRLGLADVCGNLITSEEAGRDKPHPEVFRLALRRLGSKAEQTLMVGDSLNHDVRGALAAGPACALAELEASAASHGRNRIFDRVHLPGRGCTDHAPVQPAMINFSQNKEIFHALSAETPRRMFAPDFL